MSERKQQAKVLRIGIIHDGELIEEQQIAAGEPVSIGTEEGNTFVLKETGIELASLPLFLWADGEYQLQVTPRMKGKVNLGGKGISVDKLRKENEPAQEGLWSITLTEEDRGKVKLAPITVLFRFVDPPPLVVAAPLDQMDFSPRWIEDDDPVFLGILSIWLMLGTIFGVYVYNAEKPLVEMEDIDERFTQIIIRRTVEPDVVEEDELEDAIEDENARKVKKKDPEPEQSDKPPPKNKVEAAQQKADTRDRVAKDSKLFQQLSARMIGTTGENALGTIANPYGGDFGDDIDAKLREAAAAGADLDVSGGLRGSGVAGGTGDRNIGELEAGEEVGNADLGAAPKVAVKPAVSAGDLDFDGGDVKGLGRVVRRYQGQLKYCYERRLKENPSLSGRVVLGWTVEAEKAIDVYVAENGTGDAEFAKCLKGKVARWNFSGVEDGDAKQPFVFTPDG
jgi:hypothetical protein